MVFDDFVLWLPDNFDYILSAMAVEASINSKKAAPVFKQNIIGKGITTLDDFNEYSPVSCCITSSSKAKLCHLLWNI